MRKRNRRGAIRRAFPIIITGILAAVGIGIVVHESMPKPHATPQSTPAVVATTAKPRVAAPSADAPVANIANVADLEVTALGSRNQVLPAGGFLPATTGAPAGDWTPDAASGFDATIGSTAIPR